jgi:hypothetical protein
MEPDKMKLHEELHEAGVADLLRRADETTDTINTIAKVCKALTDEVDELRAALAEAEKDTSRYRAIKASSWYVGPGDFWCSVEGELQDACDHNERDNSLDIAVDLAMTTGDWSV